MACFDDMSEFGYLFEGGVETEGYRVKDLDWQKCVAQKRPIRSSGKRVCQGTLVGLFDYVRRTLPIQINN